MRFPGAALVILVVVPLDNIGVWYGGIAMQQSQRGDRESMARRDQGGTRNVSRVLPRSGVRRQRKLEKLPGTDGVNCVSMRSGDCRDGRQIGFDIFWRCP